MLQPSISRAEYATLPEYHECLELAALYHHGTIAPAQYEWLETFGTFPPHIADIEVNAREALAYDEASHGTGDNDVPFELMGFADDEPEQKTCIDCGSPFTGAGRLCNYCFRMVKL